MIFSENIGWKGEVVGTVACLLVLWICSQISFEIPLDATPIPITGQTLGVILCAVLAPGQSAIWAMILYLFLGGIGMPMFAGGASGWEKLSGGGAGFLWGFLFTTILLNFIRKKIDVSSFLGALLLNLIGTVLILIFGNAWLVAKFGISDGLAYGFYPFWKGGLVKILIGSILIFVIIKLAKPRAPQLR